jgi:hypothetical protein
VDRQESAARAGSPLCVPIVNVSNKEPLKPKAAAAARIPYWWCGGLSSRSRSSFDARRIRSSSLNLSKSVGVIGTRGGGFGAAGGDGSGSVGTAGWCHAAGHSGG